MLIKSILVGAIVLNTVCCLGAAVVKTSIYRPERIGFRKQVRINNNQNIYRLDFVQRKATEKHGSRFEIRLRERSVIPGRKILFLN